MNKKRWIITLAVITVLAVSFFWGGNYAVKDNTADQTQAVSSADDESGNTTVADQPTDSSDAAANTDKQTAVVTANSKTGKTSADKSSTDKTTFTAAGSKDQYQTDPVHAGNPQPVEPKDVTVNGDVKLNCTFSVSCKTILDNLDSFNEEKLEVLPTDGVIFPATQVTFYQGESVFNVLQREMKKAGIQMEYEATPIYNSNYIEGINNIYEFDCGELSGWMYKVNGWFANYGCSRYQLQDGDVIYWVYTCDLGRDVGGYVDQEDD